MKNKSFSNEHKKKLSEKAKLRTKEKNPMWGKHHSEESKRKMSETKLERYGLTKKIRSISCYIAYDNTTKNQVLWRQKIDETGRLQGIGHFMISKVGKMTLEKKRESNRKWRPIMEAKRRDMGFIKISLEHPDCQWHHVTNDYVVATPTVIHQHIKHELGDGNMIEGVTG